MTTLVVSLTPRLAHDVARAADALDGISHEEFAIRAIQILLRSMYGAAMGRPVGYRQSKFSAAGKRRAAQQIKTRTAARRARNRIR